MKRIFNFLTKHPIYVLLIVICFVFLPQAIIKDSQSESKLIIRVIGVDKVDNQFEVSAIAYIPKASQSFVENYKVIEGKGKTLYDAISSATKETGKKIDLAHTGIVFVNSELCEQGLVESVDFLVKDYSLGNNTFVVYVPNSTKEIIKAANTLTLSSGIKLSNVADFDEEKIIHGNSNIESVYDSAYSPSKCALLNIMEISEEQGLEPSGESSSAEEGGGNSKNSETQNSKKILNSGKILVLKSAKKALTLDVEQANMFKWTRNSKFSDILIIENYSDDNFDNATLTFDVEENKVSYELGFENGVPVYKIKINPHLSLVEVNQKNINNKTANHSFNYFSQTLENHINSKIFEDVTQILNLLKNQNLDVNKIYEKFNAVKTKEFQNFIKKLSDKEKYFQNISFQVEVNAIIE